MKIKSFKEISKGHALIENYSLGIYFSKQRAGLPWEPEIFYRVQRDASVSAGKPLTIP